MSALRVVGIALAAVMMTLVLKKENGAAALAVSVAAGVIVLLSAVSDITYLVSYLRGLVANADCGGGSRRSAQMCRNRVHNRFRRVRLFRYGRERTCGQGYFCRSDTCSRYGLAPRDFVH